MSFFNSSNSKKHSFFSRQGSNDSFFPQATNSADLKEFTPEQSNSNDPIGDDDIENSNFPVPAKRIRMRQSEDLSPQPLIMRDPDKIFGLNQSCDDQIINENVPIKESDALINKKTDAPQKSAAEKEKSTNLSTGGFLNLKLPENGRVSFPKIEAKSNLNSIPSSRDGTDVNHENNRDVRVSKEIDEQIFPRRQLSSEVNKQTSNSAQDVSSKSFDFQAESWAMSTFDIQQKVESTIQIIAKTKEEFQDIMESFLIEKYNFVLATNKKLYEQSGFQLALSVIEMEDGVKSLRLDIESKLGK